MHKFILNEIPGNNLCFEVYNSVQNWAANTFFPLFSWNNFIQNSHKMVINTANELIKHDFVFMKDSIDFFFIDIYIQKILKQCLQYISRYLVCTVYKWKQGFFLTLAFAISRFMFSVSSRLRFVGKKNNNMYFSDAYGNFWIKSVGEIPANSGQWA